MAKPSFLLAGIIFWGMGAFCHFYPVKLLFWETYPLRILVLPFAIIGGLIFVYGLLAKKRVVPAGARRIKK